MVLESLGDVPAIEIKWIGNIHRLECLGDDCQWSDWADTPEEAIQMKNEHVKWHEEGMQE